MSEVGFKLLGDNSHFRAMIDNSTNLVTRLGLVMSTFGVGISVAGSIAFFKNIADKVGAIQDLSDRLGVSTDALQSFGFMAQQAGAKTEQATMMWEKARKAFDELAAGTPAVVKQFEAIGITQKMMLGLNTEQKLLVMAQAFKQNEKEAGVYSTVCELLGSKALPKLNTVLLRLGEEGWAGFNKGAREAGILIGGDVIGRIDELGDRLDAQQGRMIKAAAVTMDWWISLNHIPEALMAIAKHAVPDVLVKFGAILGTIPKFLGAAAEAAVGIDIPFVGLEKQAKKAADVIATILPPIIGLTEAQEKQVKIQLEKTRHERESLERSERMVLLKQDEMNIETALAQTGVTRSVSEALNLSLAETRKQMRVEEKAINAEEQKHFDRMTEFRAKEIEDKSALLSASKQMTLLKADEAGWLAVIADKEISAEVRRNAEVELAKVRGKMRDVDLKKIDEQVELVKLLLIPTEKLTAEEKIRLDLLTGVTTQKQLDEEFTRLAAGAVAGALLPAEKERLAALVGSSEEYAKQLAAAAGITEEAKAFVLTLDRKGAGYEQQSTDALLGVRDRIKAQLDAARRQNAAAPRSQYNPIEVSLAAEYQQIMNELSARENVGDYANKFGETKARGKYGDELVDRALRDLTDVTTRQTTAIEDIQQRLQLLFPKK